MQEVEGIIVKETEYSNTSKIINLLTKEYGLIGLIAKGCNRPKSPLTNLTTKLTYGKFIIYYKENSLSLLKDVNIINYFKNIKTNIERISYATYLLELAEQVSKQNNDKEIYKILINALNKIEQNFDAAIIMNIVEIKYLNYLGIGLSLNGCALCGSKENIVTLSVDEGGYLCAICYNGKNFVCSKTLKLIKIFNEVDIQKISTLKISDDVRKELNLFLEEYYRKNSGLYLKSKKFIKNLEKILEN